ncbi:glycerol-3-phosphate acyltransferase, putative [Ixodes scapularis]|uniref:Glycerol-3-phosphate acyltransferase, putative n=1 Tax=Ixodes scapularis TaxID=6945 RepID=B7PBT7_IXOSC|nr:glycerol-3-phosphate acyltransferase, putative [Ixodes scapularis]|eukprot:XP_002408854.1 glycerol-3-phosphate acyltransferase, putative [Ixodes scapularis]
MIAALLVFVSVYLAVRALMVKLLQNLQDVYSKWEAKSKPRISRSADESTTRQWTGTLDTQDGSKPRPQKGGKLLPRRNLAFNPGRHGTDKVRVPTLGHVQRSKVSFVDEVLPQFKQYPPPEEVRQLETLRHFALQCCSKCLPMSKSSFTVDGSIVLHGLDNALTLPSDGRSWLTPLKFVKNSIYLTCKSIPHEYKPISKKMLRSESIQRAIDKAVQDDPGTDKKEHQRRAISIFERMRATISTALLRLAVWLMHRLMSRMLTGVYVPKGQIDLLKRASEHNIPMVYLPLHRSHLDYILVTFLLYLNELKVPLVAAGDNLLIPLFGTLLRGLGGFFIKRRLDFKDGRKDHLYRAVLKEYMMEILKSNHSLEFFLEGGRSRTGKTRLPKAGLLSVIVSCLNEELMQDVYIVPISISYEKILDGNFVKSSMSLALMSTNLVAFLLLTKHRKGATLQQLAHSLTWLRTAVGHRDHQVMCPGESVESVRHACALLGKDLVLSETIQMEWSSGDTENNNLKIVFYRPMLRLPGVLELQYYANAVLDVFVHESIVATALFSLVGDELPLTLGTSDVVTVSRKELVDKCQDLVNILQHEFVLVLPCNNAVWVVGDAIGSLITANILAVCQKSGQAVSSHHRKWANCIEWDQENDEYSSELLRNDDERLKVILDEKNICMLEFLQCILASYVESYWVVACSLSKLVNTQMEEKIFFRQIQKMAQDKLHQGLLYYDYGWCC